MSNANAANWVLSRRIFHWGLALMVLIALLAPKPEDGDGLLHILAGSIALALVLARLGLRLLADARPYVKDAWRLSMPDISKGPRGFAPLLMQGARIVGFLFLALVPVAVGLGLGGVAQGEDSPLLEAHEAAGSAIMALAIAHVVAAILFTLIIKYNLLGITLFGGVRSFFEGGRRGVWGLTLGALLGIAALAYIWGPFDVSSKASALTEWDSGREWNEHRVGD